MKSIKAFIKMTLIGGLIVILPIMLFIVVARWILGMIAGALQPLTDLILSTYDLPEAQADAISIVAIFILCFLVGLMIKTRLGTVLYQTIEDRVLLKIAPGYSFIKETTGQFLSSERRPFSSVALVQISEIDMLVTAFVTDTNPDGTYTVFVPNGPNPMSGNMYHLGREYVHIVDVSVEDTMKTIIGCGAGSARLIKARMDKETSTQTNSK